MVKAIQCWNKFELNYKNIGIFSLLVAKKILTRNMESHAMFCCKYLQRELIELIMLSTPKKRKTPITEILPQQDRAGHKAIKVRNTCEEKWDKADYGLIFFLVGMSHLTLIADLYCAIRQIEHSTSTFTHPSINASVTSPTESQNNNNKKNCYLLKTRVWIKKKTSFFCCQGQKWFFEIFTVIICTVHNAYRVRVILMRLSRMNASFEVTCKLLLKLKSSICTIFCYKILHWTAFSWNDCAITNSGWVDTVKTLQNDNLCKSQLAFHKFQTFWIFTKL